MRGLSGVIGEKIISGTRGKQIKRETHACLRAGEPTATAELKAWESAKRRNGQILETPEPRNLLLVPTGDGGATKTLKLETLDLSSGKRCRHRKKVAPVHVEGMRERMEVIDSGCEPGYRGPYSSGQ